MNLPFLMQGLLRPLHGADPTPWFILIGIAAAVLFVIGWRLADVGASRIRAGVIGRRRLRAAATAEVRTRALMSELCPHGWRAQITLFGPGDELPGGAPATHRVALDWAELQDRRRGVAVVRRVWASSIGEALEAMVADRRTDETLEQIERSAVPEGTLWPDL